MTVRKFVVPFVLLLHCLFTFALIHAQTSYIPFSAVGASSVMIEGKGFYVQGGVSNGLTKSSALRQTFSIDLSGTWSISHPPYSAMADGLDDSLFPGTLLTDGDTWFMIHRNTTVFHYNLASQTIAPKGLIANYSSIEGLHAFLDPNNNVIVPNGYWGQSGPVTTLSISSTSLLSQQLPSLPGINGLRYYASAWSASEKAYFVFGGWNLAYSGDFVRFDVSSSKWSSISATGSPAPRDAACLASAYGGTKLVLFGGESSTSRVVLSDIYVFDVAKGTWLPGLDGGVSRARAGGVCGVSGDSLVLWGGYTDLNARGPVQEILSIYNLKTNAWQQRLNDVGGSDGSGSGNGNGSVSNPPLATSSAPNVAAIAGGVAAAVVIVAAVAFFLYRRKKANGAVVSSQQPYSPHGSSGYMKTYSQVALQPLGHTKETQIKEVGYRNSSTEPYNSTLVSKEYNAKSSGPQQYPVTEDVELDYKIEAHIGHLQTLMAQKNAMESQRSTPGPQAVVYNTQGNLYDSPYEAPRGPQSSPPKIPQRPMLK
ncbi:hypothetical protein BG003_008632 [Podila horticola]|nr:hypothetical protein BG003_008632 [Podila horticola]